MEKIFEFVKHNNVQNIEVCFVDLFGKSRIITIPKSRLMHALKNGLSFDGSSINGQNNVENSDMKLTLDKNSFYFLPNQNMLVFANTSYKFDSRAKLQKLEKKLLKRNLNVFVGAELEFFLFEKSKIKIKNLENFNLNIADAIDCFLKEITTFHMLSIYIKLVKVMIILFLITCHILNMMMALHLKC